MRKRIVLLAALLLVMIPSTVKASIFCSYETKTYLKQLASNINISYDFVEENDRAIFKLTLSNVHKNLIIREKNTDRVFYPSSSKELSEIVLENYESGKTYQFDVYSTVSDCNDEILMTFYVNLPYYNSYYKEEVCKGLDSYPLCTRWNRHGLSKDKFIENVTNYKESLKEETPTKEEETKSKGLSFLLDFYLNYYYIILPIIIVVFGFMIYRLNKKESFF